jgi:hypothetical protein
VALRETLAACEPPAVDVLALQEAQREDPVKAQLVNLRYFAGMTLANAAQVLRGQRPGQSFELLGPERV